MAAFAWRRILGSAGPEQASPPLPPPPELRWRALLETTDDAILVVDGRGAVLVTNRAADRMFPAAPGIGSGEPAAGGLLAHTLSGALFEVYRDAVRHGALREAEVTLAQPAPLTLHVRVTPVSDSEFLVVLHDLTELRRLERVRRDFVANVSHELRTPLTSIKAMAETLLDGARADEAVAPRFLETIVHECDRLVRLSSDLLDLSRVEAHAVEKSAVDVRELVNDVVGRLGAQAKKAGVALTNSVPDRLMVPGDRDELGQVILNLIDNAITYTQPGGAVTVTSRDDADTVTLAVADTGIGILSHDIPRLFERFYRADKARSRASGGTGLGLSIVKHIVERHGGAVAVESEYNRGSVFSLTLPKGE